MLNPLNEIPSNLPTHDEVLLPLAFSGEVDRTVSVRAVFTEHGIDTQDKDANAFKARCPHSSCDVLINCKNGGIVSIKCHSDKCKDRSIQSFLDGWKIPADAFKAPKVSEAKESVERAPGGVSYETIIDGIEFVLCPVNGLHFTNTRRELVPANKDGLSQDIRRRKSQATSKIQTRSDVTNAMETAIALAEDTATRRRLHLRFGTEEGVTWINLGNGKCVRIADGDWSVVDESPLTFIQDANHRPYPIPTRGGEMADLDPVFPNIGYFQQILVVVWLLSTFADIPVAILHLIAPPGFGKTFFMKMLLSFSNPCESTVCPTEVQRTPNDVILIASKDPVLAYDNVGKLTRGQSDVLCSVVTGGGSACRKLYTDSNVISRTVRRPILLGSVTDVIKQPDLKSRAITVRLAPLETRRTESQLSQMLTEEARARIFGFLLTGLAAGLKGVADGNHPDDVGRMADWYSLAWNACPSLGIEQDDFTKAMATNLEDARQTAVDNSPLLRLLVDGGGFTGTKTALARKAGLTTGEVSDELPMIAPSLLAEGFAVDLNARSKNRTRIVTISRK